ncbi:hypothetical protein BDV18DRAFT_130387 [Aspergillus unguis]
MLWQYLALIVLFGVTTVQAGSDWEDFANNFAADLAPLVALFGERLTKQFLAESTSILDNYIFSLCPLGILTAVVSVIRICGNSSLRAFVGRANEAPGEAENELLSCVSEGTAELFNDGGISRVFGRPRILEVICYEENGSYKLGSLRDAIKSGAWSVYGEDTKSEGGLLSLPEIDIPNLSLNKGIKRRSIGWFWASALLGTILQGGVYLYAAITVFWYPSIFSDGESSAESYALPLYVFGSTALSLGMFLCGFLIERSSCESYIYSTNPSKIYWLQPGRQKIGDQDFGAFLAADEGSALCYIKSVRGPPPKGRRPLLVFTICTTGLGFVAQFVGLRGLHPSVILADVGSTLLMAVVRTCLRTKRIGSNGNRFREEDQKLFSRNQQELDCFAYHVENVKSFHMMSGQVNQSVRSRAPSLSTIDSSVISGRGSGNATKLIQTRARLAGLTSCPRHPSMDWDDLPIRKVAHSLARTIETTLEVVSRWEETPGRTCIFELTFACHPEGKARGSLETYPIRLTRSEDTFQWKVCANELEAILGLWTYSLVKSNPSWLENKFVRAVGLTKQEASAEATDLYFHKWIFRQREAIMVSADTISFPEQTFGYYPDNNWGSKDILVVRTDNDLATMAAQDIYIQFLMTVLNGVESLGGTADILPISQNSFLAQSTDLDELVSCFETGALGSREDALLCIVPILKHHNLLPELAGDSSTVRNRVEYLISVGNWNGAFSLMQWLCERCDSNEYERSVYELGFLCQRAMLHRDSGINESGFKAARTLLQLDVRAEFFRMLKITRPAEWMNTQVSRDWWIRFSSQFGWVTWNIAAKSANLQAYRPLLECMGFSHEIEPFEDRQSSVEGHIDANTAKLTYLGWVVPTSQGGLHTAIVDHGNERDIETCVEWLIKNEQNALCHWILARWVETSPDCPHLIMKAFVYAAKNNSDFAVQTLLRRGANIDTPGNQGCTALLELVGTGQKGAVARLLANGAGVNAYIEGTNPPLSLAAGQGNEEMVTLLLDHGANFELRVTDSFTPLHTACQFNQCGTAALLLDRGADINSKSSGGYTPLLLAAAQGNLEMFHFLLDKGADSDATDDDGNTILMHAVFEPSGAVLRLLLDRGVNPQMREDSRRTALELAKRIGSSIAIGLLEAAP